MSKLSAQNPYDEHGNPRPPLYYDYDGNYYYEQPDGFEWGKVWAVFYAFAAFISISGGGFIGMIAFALLAYDAFTEQPDEDDEPQPQYLPPATQVQQELPTHHYPPIAASPFGQFQPQQQVQPAASWQPQQSVQPEPMAYAQSNQPIGPQTRLGALPIIAASVDDSAPRSNVYRVDDVIPPVKTVNPADLLIRPNHSPDRPCTTSAIICAAPRGGKGNTIERCIERMRAYHPTAEIWAIDPKDDHTEHWYWRNCTKVYRCSITNPSFDAAKHGKAIVQFIREWGNSPAPIKILIVDECVSLKAKLDKQVWKWITDVMVSISSSGPSRGMFAWALTQSSVNTDLGLSSVGVKSSFANLYLASIKSAERINHQQSALASRFISSGCPDEIINQTGFACHFGGKWLPVGENDPTDGDLLEAQVRFHSTSSVTEQGNQELIGLFDSYYSDEPNSAAPPANDGAIEKPDLSDREIYKLAMELEQWIAQHPEIEQKDWASRWNAHKKGLSRPQFRYLLTLIED